MTKVIHIETPEKCPHFAVIFPENNIVCGLDNERKCNLETFPDDCPLTDGYKKE